MRIRFWTAVAVSGLSVAGVLTGLCRLPAGEIVVPAAAEVQASDGTLPVLGAGIPAPIHVEARPLAEAGPVQSVFSSGVKPVKFETSEPLLAHGLSIEKEASQSAPKVVPAAEAKPAVPTMLVHSRKLELNFNIADVGPSGVAAVELWATRDGHAWQRYSNEPPPSGPLVVCVAEEGRYGFSIVVRNGVGVASPAPKTDEAPQLWVEVDETKPHVELTDCRAIHGADSCRLQLGWKASDVNLGAKPITVSYSPSKDGPWTPVAAAIENSGVYTSEMPKDVPYRFYVRVEAADKAGHVGSAVTHEPIKVDTCRPKGAILGVDSASKPVSKAPAEEQKQAFNFIMGWTR